MAATPDHSSLDQSVQGIHVPFQFSFADEASRVGAPASRLIGGASKLAYQQDTSSLWLLASASPTPTWASMAAGIVSSGLGGVSEGANLGTGIPVFREKTGASLLFKTLVPGAATTISSSASIVTLANETGGISLGTGIPIFRELEGASLTFRSLIAGSSVSIASATSGITINATPAAGSEVVTEGVNLGTGFGVLREKSGASLLFKTLVGAGDLTLSSAASAVTITGGSTRHFSATIGASNTWNNELIPLWQAPRGGSVTIVEVLSTTSGTNTPTLSFNLQHRDWDAMQSAGNDIFAASQIATSAGEQVSSFARDTVDPRGHLMFTTGSGAEGGSVNYLQITVYYTI